MKNILLLSNGHAEDLAGAGIGIEIKKIYPEIELTALPMVGMGNAYEKAGIKQAGLKKILPSGGFAKEGLLFFLKDLLSGWLGIFYQQIKLLQQLGKQNDLIIGVGDAYLVAMAGLFSKKPLIFIDGPKSVRIVGYWPIELWLMKKFCKKIIVQDKETAEYLQNKGLPALYLGTWVMDYVPVTGDNFNLPADETVIGILPGTREEAYDNLGLILDVLAELKDEKFTCLIASTLDQQKLKDRGLLDRIEKFPRSIRLIKGKFGNVCVRSNLIIGLAGIANEQAAGFGKPVVCFPGKGPQTTLRRWQEIHKITGDSMLILTGSITQIATEIRDLLHDQPRLAKMSQIGKESKPDWGGIQRIAELAVINIKNATSSPYPYIIITPDYRHNSNGIKVLHKLAHLLNQAGQTAYVFCKKTNPKWNSPSISIFKGLELIKKGAIVVYPEIVSGNPLKANTVVRYMLNNPGLCGGDKTYPKSEILFSYVKQLLLPNMEQDRVLCIPTIDTSIFYGDNSKRDLDYLVYFGKHKKVAGYPKNKIIYNNKPGKPIELANILRRCNKLITYDPFTLLIFEATLCGCPVVIMPDNFRKKEDIENNEFGFYGVVWEDTKEALQRAKANIAMAKIKLEQIEKQAKESINIFIAITQQSAQNDIGTEQPLKIASIKQFLKIRKLYQEAR